MSNGIYLYGFTHFAISCHCDLDTRIVHVLTNPIFFSQGQDKTETTQITKGKSMFT